ncbi:MAG: PaaI family thioesterase [Ilumatobacteraceae bacterium]
MNDVVDNSNNFTGFHIRTGEMSEYDQARSDFAEEVRAVIGELLSTSASIADIRAAHKHVTNAVALLGQREHAQDFFGPSEAALAVIGSFLDRSPIVGAINPLAVPMRVFSERDDSGEMIAVGRVIFGTAYEGPPGCVHGGFIAAAFDEVLGVAQSLSGNPGMTVNLSVDYRSPTPLNQQLLFRGRITKIDGRKISTIGTLHYGDTLCAEASGLFISMRPEVFEKLLKIRQGGKH